MIGLDIQKLLYQGNSSCLHSVLYEVRDEYQHKQCGPCFIRAQFISEVPSQVTMRKLSEAGTPDFNPQFNGHLLVVLGLFAPEPGEALHSFRKRRDKISRPTAALFPTTSALWKLMGNQPPLAVPMLDFCSGWNEFDIAERHSWSIFDVQLRLGKASRAIMRPPRRQWSRA